MGGAGSDKDAETCATSMYIFSFRLSNHFLFDSNGVDYSQVHIINSQWSKGLSIGFAIFP